MTPSHGVQSFLSLRDRLAREGWFDGAERALADRLTAVVVGLAGSPLPGAAIVATGGFGRGVMALRSDVDLLFLHTRGGEEDLARRVLRPLWDAHLKVGHLSHTPRDARVFAGTRLDAVSTFLTARLLWGDEDVFDDFRRRFTRLLQKEHAAIVAAMAAEERRRRDEEPYRLMAGDLKNGRGGLRTLDLVDWRRRLFEAQAAAAPDVPGDDGAVRVALTRVRSALHAIVGRPHDHYDFELREPAARWLGSEVRELGRHIVELRSESERMVDAGWREVVRRPVRGAFPDSTRSRDRGDVVAWFDGAVSAPALRRILDEPHVVPFHRHPVGDHTLATVDIAWQVLDGDVREPIAAEAVAMVAHPHRLVEAALFHDLGKGLGGDHSRVGAGLVAEAAAELGLPEIDVDMVRRLVAHHLLLADVATRFDVDDPAVVAWAADRIGDVETLRFLYLLTMVDSMATGSDVWSPWRAELMRRAYRRLEREIIRRNLPEESQLSVLVDAVVEVSESTLDGEAVRRHLAGFGVGYRRSHSAAVIAEHMRVASEPLGPGGGTVSIQPGAPARLIVSASDRPRLLVDVAAVLAVNRLSIIDARFATRSDGRVFDTFEIVDAGHGPPSPSQIESARSEIVRALRGGVDTGRLLSQKEHAYRDARRAAVPVHVNVARSDDGGGVVEVECADRLGLLRDLGVVFDRFGMPIVRARIDTRGGVAYDTFQVGRIPADAGPLVDGLREAAGPGSGDGDHR